MRAVWVALILALAFASGAAGQEARRVTATIDYVGVEGVYLAVGTDVGVQAGDTLHVYASEGETESLGRVVVSAASRRRSVVSVVGSDLTLEAGGSVWLAVRRAGAAAALAVAAPGVAAGAVATAEGPAAAAPVEVRRRSTAPRVTGRISLDLDGRETRTSWEGDLFGTTTRRFATPTSALSLTVRELPGGFQVETSLRASYRYSDFTTIQPTTSVRLYSLSAVKRFDSFPLELRMGRFYNPYESYSAYWDGAMMRLGGRTGFGIGGAAGYEPVRANERFSNDLFKFTGFTDFAARGRGWRYDTDVSVHMVRPGQDTLSERTFAGWSQSLTVGRVSLNQRVRADQDTESGEWSLTQIRLRGGFRLAGPFRLNGGFNRIQPGVIRGLSPLLSPEREEVTGGIGAFGTNGSFSVDVGSTKWNGETGLSLAAAFSRRIGGALFSVSGRRWSRSDMTSLSAAPGVSFDLGPVETRLGYQFYETESFTRLRSQSGDIALTTRVGDKLSITLRGQQQWGSNFGGTRLGLRLWRSF